MGAAQLCTLTLRALQKVLLSSKLLPGLAQDMSAMLSDTVKRFLVQCQLSRPRTRTYLVQA